MVAWLAGCSAGGDGSSYGNGGSAGNAGADGGSFDTGYTGDGEIDPDSSCAATSLQAERVPLDMFIMADTSGSMDGTKLTALKDGLTHFLQDGESAGMGAAAQQFPLGGANESCDSNAYGSPAVPWALLPNPALVGWIGALVADGYTPTVPALQGAVDACKARVNAEPGRKCAVVLVTDGAPEGSCLPVSTSAIGPLGDIAQDAWDNGVAVFAIGFPGLSTVGQNVVIEIAKKGGTQVPIAIKEGNIDTDFTDALNEVRGMALGCEYQMPTTDTGQVNPNLVKVAYTPGDGSGTQTIPRESALADCGSGGGWAYDDNVAPTKLIMCASTCDAMRADPTGKIDILLGCTDNQR